MTLCICIVKLYALVCYWIKCDCQQEQVSSQLAEKKLDIDEDKENPAYIPRKGYFYEHDMRNEAADDSKNEYSITTVGTYYVTAEAEALQCQIEQLGGRLGTQFF